jgi:hypothetical protein
MRVGVTQKTRPGYRRCANWSPIGDERLVTVVGVGGVGESRLILEFAPELQTRRMNGEAGGGITTSSTRYPKGHP